MLFIKYYDNVQKVMGKVAIRNLHRIKHFEINFIKNYFTVYIVNRRMINNIKKLLYSIDTNYTHVLK